MIDDTEQTGLSQDDIFQRASEIVSAYVSNNSVPVGELPALLAGVHEALLKLAVPALSAPEVADKPTPAQVRKSITPDALISFIDGKPYKTLKRHLSRNGLTIEQYRERYGLPRDYPSTAASYSAQRSELARSLGLGQQGRKSAAAKAPSEARRGKRSSRRASSADGGGYGGSDDASVEYSYSDLPGNPDTDYGKPK